MIKSMTGFASLTRENEQMQLTVTVKSVNHRYLDVQIRVPPALAELEARVRGAIQHRAARGRIELAVTMQLKVTPGVSLEINESLVMALSANGLVAEPVNPRPSSVPLLKVCEAPSTSWQLRQNGSSPALVWDSQVALPLIHCSGVPLMVSLS